MKFYNLPDSPYLKAGCLSRLFFWWLNKLFWKGYKKALTMEDLYHVIPPDDSSTLGTQLALEWSKQYERYLTSINLQNNLSPLLERWEQKTKRKKFKPNLLVGIWKIFHKNYILLGLFPFIEECIIRIAQPLSLGFLIRCYTNKGEYPPYVLYLTASAIVLAGILYNFTHHIYFFGVSHIGLQIRIACCSLLYRKALKLNQLSLQKTAIGQVVNLMSNDVNRFDQSPIFLHYLWIGPLQAALITGILWLYIGPYTFVGLFILLLNLPVQVCIGKRFSTLRESIAQRTDKRIQILSEIISGIRVIKMLAWENPFSKFVASDREDEMWYMQKSTILRALHMTIFLTAGKIIVFITLLVYVLTGNGLTAELVFVTLSLYNNVRSSMNDYFAFALITFAETLTSVRRFEKFLLMEERNVKIESENNAGNEIGVRLTNVSAKWDPDQDESTLKYISFHLKPGQLIVIIGHVGAGKGSILHTILKELPISKGNLEVVGEIGYAAQECWLFSGSVRDNILFGKLYQHEWYQQVIEACALEHDLELLPFGDATLVSDRGQTLSGGQKSRISLARAVYANADIYLLDDPLASTDANVGQQIFFKCITGILKSKARILVTHQIQFLKHADHIIILENGSIHDQGTYTHLIRRGIDFEQLAKKIMATSKSDIKASRQPSHYIEQYVESPFEGKSVTRRSSAISGKSKNYVDSSVLNIIKNFQGDSIEVASPSSKSVNYPIPEMTENYPNLNKNFKTVVKQSLEKKPEELEEKQEVGGVNLRLYFQYFRAGSNWCNILILISLGIIYQFFYIGSDYWLTYWTDAETWKKGKLNKTYKISNRKNPLYYLYNDRIVQIWGYTTVIVILVLVSLIWSFLFFRVCIKSSIKLHQKMFRGVIRAPMQFFELNSAGRILNRFSKDIGQIDESLPYTLFDVITTFLTIFATVIIVSVMDPIMLIPAIILSVLIYLLHCLYLRTARSIKRLEGIAKSPVFSHLATSLYGITTIRSFHAQEYFIKYFDEHQNVHSSTWYLYLATSRWLAIWLDWITSLYVTIVTYAFVFTAKNGAELGLVISSAMSMAGFLQWGVRQLAEIENQMVSTERVMEYSKLTSEAALHSDPDRKPPDDWPQGGKICFENVSLFYGDHAVLTDVTFAVLPSEKIGIVGRTGAGKSSLISVLFRLVEPMGEILIDDVHIKQIGLHDLREKISIIPQDPVLFYGTIRKNLDPFDMYQDDAIWSALEGSHMAHDVRQLPMSLKAPMAEGGCNFSVGQRQLFCLCRAILRNNKIIILDEATANVDLETDHLIQKTISTKFKSSTVLTIAHRLHTVMDCDKILVLDAGQVMEFDEPYKLLEDKESSLRDLVEKTGSGTAERLFEQAKLAHEKRVKGQEI